MDTERIHKIERYLAALDRGLLTNAETLALIRDVVQGPGSQYTGPVWKLGTPEPVR